MKTTMFHLYAVWQIVMSCLCLCCISGALSKDTDGIVQMDEQKCIACWSCIAVCPYGTIKRLVDEHSNAAKCDMCIGAELPACVANCPNEALVLEEH